MSGGGLSPISLNLGTASGLLSPTFYSPSGAAASITGQGQIEGIQVAASLASQANAILHFLMPETIPSGTLKLRLLAMSNATTGTAFWTTSDGATSPGSSIQNTALTAETAQSINFATLGVADVMNENKQSLTTVPTSNQILTVIIAFGTTIFTLAQTSLWVPSIVWE